MRYSALLNEKTALIAGDGGPLRRAVAALFAAQGARVALLGGADDTSVPGCPLFAAEASDGEGMERAGQAALAHLGHIDVVVTVFAAHHPALAADGDEADAWNALARGPEAVLRTVQLAAAGMMERRHGAFVHVLPVYARYVVPGVSATAAGSGAVAALSKAIAMDYCKFDVRSNCLLYSASFLDDEHPDAFWAETQVLPRRLGAEEVANAALYLASDMAKHVTGETLTADGGTTLIAHKQVYP